MSARLHGITCFESGRQIVGKIKSSPPQNSPTSVNRNLYYRAANLNSWLVSLKFLSLAEESLEFEIVANSV